MRSCIVLTLILLLGSCQTEQSNQGPKPTLFRSIDATRSRIDFSNTLSPSPQLNILNYIYYYNGAGIATADFNKDDLPDLYFVSNQGPDALYLNTGDLTFDDVTTQSGIDNATGWSSGVISTDINQDGWTDIYITKTGTHGPLDDHNQLWIHQGLDADGIPYFKEESEAYGLDFRGYSTHAAFFDYDADNDLDLFLLNHSINPNQNYGKGSVRNLPNYESGDKLFENIDGRFVDVSKEAGILQSKIGYGLGVSIGDFNNDGWPDMYVGNDFFENDYLYLNQGDKTFSEQITPNTGRIGHTTHYSMGNDSGDLNNDGWLDLISVDMLPEDLITYKTSGNEFNYQIYHNFLRNGYQPQYMHNSLQLNQGGARFVQTAFASGIAASEWSWSPLIFDADLDGWNDIYITNGIVGATNDMDFINFIANESIQKSLGQGMDESSMGFIEKIPEKKTQNYFYQNLDGRSFADRSEDWSPTGPSWSNGSVYVDLDRDGDLDLVTNNVNQPAYVLENTLIATNSSMTIAFDGPAGNRQGIGAKVSVYTGANQQHKENYPSRGYLSSVLPELTFGITSDIDSLVVTWPDGQIQSLIKPEPGRLTLDHEASQGTGPMNPVLVEEPFDQHTLIDFVHQENQCLEFNQDPLIPYASTNQGPCMSVADFDNNGLEDLFIGGAKGQASALYYQQTDGSFERMQNTLFEEHSLNEDTASLALDINADGMTDLIVASGGNEFKQGPAIQPRLYLNTGGSMELVANAFEGIMVDASSLGSTDLNGDGFPDLLITSGSMAGAFGETPKQWLLQNKGNNSFRDATGQWGPKLVELGNVTDQAWQDLDEDGDLDLILAGKWMPISIFKNEQGRLTPMSNPSLKYSNGWWSSLLVTDVDQDGDPDIIAGNWGLNSRLTASKEEPVRLYRIDVDDNGKVETLVTHYYQGQETLFASKDDLTKQIPMLNKEYLSYLDFAQAELQDLIPPDKWDSALQKEVYQLQSCWFENTANGSFETHPLPWEAQLSSVEAMAAEESLDTGLEQLFLAGNNFELSTQLSRLDASHGTLLTKGQDGTFRTEKERDFYLNGAVRSIKKIALKDGRYWIIAMNNNQPIFIKINPNDY